MLCKILCSWLVLCIFFIAVVLADDAPPAIPKQYTAEIEITSSSGTVSLKRYVDFSLVRTDATIGSVPMEMIVSWEKKTSVTILPAIKVVLLSSISGSSPFTTGALPTNGTWKNLGMETLNGVACHKYQFDEGKGKTSFFWFRGINPVQIQATDNSVTITYKSFITGKPDPTLFQIPTEGFQSIKMDKPSI